MKRVISFRLAHSNAHELGPRRGRAHTRLLTCKWPARERSYEAQGTSAAVNKGQLLRPTCCIRAELNAWLSSVELSWRRQRVLAKGANEIAQRDALCSSWAEAPSEVLRAARVRTHARTKNECATFIESDCVQGERLFACVLAGRPVAFRLEQCVVRAR